MLWQPSRSTSKRSDASSGRPCARSLESILPLLGRGRSRPGPTCALFVLAGHTCGGCAITLRASACAGSPPGARRPRPGRPSVLPLPLLGARQWSILLPLLPSSFLPHPPPPPAQSPSKGGERIQGHAVSFSLATRRSQTSRRLGWS